MLVSALTPRGVTLVHVGLGTDSTVGPAKTSMNVWDRSTLVSLDSASTYPEVSLACVLLAMSR